MANLPADRAAASSTPAAARGTARSCSGLPGPGRCSVSTMKLRHFGTSRGLIHRSSVVRGNLVQTAFADATFGLLTSLQTIEHLWEQPRFIAECARILAPGGTARTEHAEPADLPERELVPHARTHGGGVHRAGRAGARDHADARTPPRRSACTTGSRSTGRAWTRNWPPSTTSGRRDLAGARDADDVRGLRDPAGRPGRVARPGPGGCRTWRVQTYGRMKRSSDLADDQVDQRRDPPVHQQGVLRGLEPEQVLERADQVVPALQHPARRSRCSGWSGRVR